ncbi:MAG: 2-oxoacid:acceptor oxidoreductase family protein [bacterium]|nr:2-oxoacid:acceptor oxidoreductase family protein [bacterium]
MERAVVMTGLGGQGIQLAAKLLAEAAMLEGREVMMFGIFMGMIRGGSSESTVVIGDRPIETPPIVPSAWAVLAMHGDGLAKLGPKLEPGGIVCTNRSLVTSPPAWPGVRQVDVAATDLAKEMGQPLGASMIALGAFVRATGIVGLEALGRALDTVLPPHRRKHAEANRRCLERGADAVAAPAGETAWT